MFSTIDWYFSRQVLATSALVGMIFYALFFIVGLLEHVDAPLSLDNYLLSVGLGTFAFFYDFLPTVILMAFLFAFGSMAAKNEVIALQTLGYPFKSLLSTVIKGTLLVLLIWGVLMEYIFPLSVNHAKSILTKTSNSDNISISSEWIRSNNAFIKILSAQGENIFGITIYQLDAEGKLSDLYEAKKGIWRGDRLSLYTPKHTHYQYTNIAPPQGLKHIQVFRTPLKEKTFSTGLTLATFSYSLLEPNQMYLPQLLDYANYILSNKIDGGEGQFIFAFWERLLMPLGIIGLILMVMPTMLGTPRVQHIGDRIFMGIGVGVCYFILTELARNSSIYITLPNSILATLLPMLSLASGSILCYRANRVN